MFSHSPTGISQSIALAFISGLDHSSEIVVSGLLKKFELIPKKIEKIKLPSPPFDHVTIEGFHLRTGSNPPILDSKFIITKTVMFFFSTNFYEIIFYI